MRVAGLGSVAASWRRPGYDGRLPRCGWAFSLKKEGICGVSSGAEVAVVPWLICWI